MNEKGISIFLSVIVLAVLLSLALGISVILVSQMRVLKGMENSVQAFFAADTGIEQALFQGQSVSGVLQNGARYEVQFIRPGRNCAGFSYCLKSVGIFKETRRAIEIIR